LSQFVLHDSLRVLFEVPIGSQGSKGLVLKELYLEQDLGLARPKGHTFASDA
jgi:hypothetical protein